MNLDYSKIEEARKLVQEGSKAVQVNCSTCQGMGSSIPSSPGYCACCRGEAYVTVEAWTTWGLNGGLDYWQARTLVAEQQLSELTSDDNCWL